MVLDHRRTPDRGAADPPAAEDQGHGGRWRPVRDRQGGLSVISRGQATTVVTALLCFLALLIIIQLWLVAASIDAALSDDTSVLWPAAIASCAIAAVNLGLLAYALDVDRRLESLRG